MQFKTIKYPLLTPCEIHLFSKSKLIMHKINMTKTTPLHIMNKTMSLILQQPGAFFLYKIFLSFLLKRTENINAFLLAWRLYTVVEGYIPEDRPLQNHCCKNLKYLSWSSRLRNKRVLLKSKIYIAH